MLLLKCMLNMWVFLFPLVVTTLQGRLTMGLSVRRLSDPQDDTKSYGLSVIDLTNEGSSSDDEEL